MAIVTRFAGDDYPNTVLGTHITVQEAINALTYPLSAAVIIEVEADADNVETIARFTITNRAWSEHRLTIRAKEGHDISISSGGGDPQIQIEISSGTTNSGNILIQDFTVLGDSTGTRAIRVSGRYSAPDFAKVTDVIFKRVIGLFQNTNRVELARFGNLTFEDCDLETPQNELFTFFGSNTVVLCEELTLRNCNLKKNGNSSYLFNCQNVWMNVLNVHGCTIDSPERGAFWLNNSVKEIFFTRNNFLRANFGLHIASNASHYVESLVIENNAFANISGYVVYGTGRIDDFTFKANTIAWYATAHSAVFLDEVADSIEVKGNILSTFDSSGTALKNFFKFEFNETILDFATIDSVFNNNLFYRHSGTNFVLYELNDNTTVTEAYTTFLQLHGILQELDGNEADPLFSDDSYVDTDWYEIGEDSPAHDFIVEHDLNSEDIRSYLRQSFYQDAGCYDIDADPLSKPADDSPALPTYYRLSDMKEYVTLGAALTDNKHLTKDETIIISQEYNSLGNPHTGIWFTNSMFTGYVLTLRASDALISAGKRPVIGVNAGVCLALEATSNLEFIDLIFQGTGDTYTCARFGWMDVDNVTFRNCLFTDAKNGIVMNVGQSIEFYDCEFTNCKEYPVYVNGGTDTIFENCYMSYGTATPTPSSTVRFAVWHRNAQGTKFKYCMFDDDKWYHIFKPDGGYSIEFIGCYFPQSINMAFWFTLGAGETTGDEILFEDCIFDFPNPHDTHLMQIDRAGNVKFINNTFRLNLSYAITQNRSVLFIRDKSKSLIFKNNYVEIITTGEWSENHWWFIRAQLELAILNETYLAENNYYNIQETDSDKIRLAEVGGGGFTWGLKTLANAQNNGLELESILVRSESITSQIDENFVPIVDSELIGAANPAFAYYPLDYNRNVRSVVDSDIGAIEKDASPPVGAAPVIDFEYQNRYESPFDKILDSDVDPGDRPFKVPAYDPYALVSKIQNYPDRVIWDVWEEFDPINIEGITVSPGNSVVSFTPDDQDEALKIVGSLQTSLRESFVIESSTNNDGAVEYDYYFYNVETGEIFIYLNTELDDAVIDGTIHWKSRIAGGIGMSLLFYFKHAYLLYNVTIKATNDYGSDTVTVPMALLSQAKRAMVRFNLGDSLVFAGDTVSLYSNAIGAVSWEWNIQTPEGAIVSYDENVLGLLYDEAGLFDVSLKVTNVDGLTETLVKSPGIIVNEAPARPCVRFVNHSPIIFEGGSIILKADHQKEASRFLSGDEIFKWQIIEANTGAIVKELYGKNPTVTSDIPFGYYDVVLTVRGPWGNTQLRERRGLTIIPTLQGKTTHSILCDPTDTGINHNGHTVSVSIIDNVTPSNGIYSSTIAAGEVIRLSGTARWLTLEGLEGTAENPIIIVPDPEFEVILESWTGISFRNCKHCYLVGSAQGLGQYKIKLHNTANPAIRPPGNTGVKIEEFSTDIAVIGLEIYNINFAGMQAKTDPHADRPATWRNVGDFRLMNTIIAHNYIHDTHGEGLYFGFFSEGKRGVGSVASGYPGVDYYAHGMGDTKVFRNIFRRNGFDSIQLGCHYLGLNEVHDNLIEDTGYLGVFGQDAAMSMNFMTGWIYNNILDGLIIFKAGIVGPQYVFNNFIKNHHRLDAIYVKCEASCLEWDWSTSPPTLIGESDYTKNDFKVWNNVITTRRGLVQVNSSAPLNYIPVGFDVVNNICIWHPSAWHVKYSPENPNHQRNIVNLMNTWRELSHLNKTEGNINRRLSDIENLLFLDFENSSGLVAPDSVALHVGSNMKSLYPHLSYYDAAGYKLPDSQGNFPVGMATWMPLHTVEWSSGVLNVFKGATPVIAVYKGSQEISLVELVR